jgi:hypothetical protein
MIFCGPGRGPLPERHVLQKLSRPRNVDTVAAPLGNGVLRLKSILPPRARSCAGSVPFVDKLTRTFRRVLVAVQECAPPPSSPAAGRSGRRCCLALRMISHCGLALRMISHCGLALRMISHCGLALRMIAHRGLACAYDCSLRSRVCVPRSAVLRFCQQFGYTPQG